MVLLARLVGTYDTYSNGDVVNHQVVCPSTYNGHCSYGGGASRHFIGSILCAQCIMNPKWALSMVPKPKPLTVPTVPKDRKALLIEAEQRQLEALQKVNSKF